jgi:hypothetical protein
MNLKGTVLPAIIRQFMHHTNYIKLAIKAKYIEERKDDGLNRN